MICICVHPALFGSKSAGVWNAFAEPIIDAGNLEPNVSLPSVFADVFIYEPSRCGTSVPPYGIAAAFCCPSLLVVVYHERTITSDGSVAIALWLRIDRFALFILLALVAYCKLSNFECDGG